MTNIFTDYSSIFNPSENQQSLNSVLDSFLSGATGGNGPVIDMRGSYNDTIGSSNTPGSLATAKSNIDSIVKSFTTGSGANATTAGASGTTTIYDTFANYFGRGVVIVLGFIFVAVGLSMFKGPAAVIQKTTRASVKATVIG